MLISGPNKSRFPSDYQKAEFTLPYSADQLATLQNTMSTVFPSVGFEVSGVEYSYKVVLTASKLSFEAAIKTIFPGKKPYIDHLAK